MKAPSKCYSPPLPDPPYKKAPGHCFNYPNTTGDEKDSWNDDDQVCHCTGDCSSSLTCYCMTLRRFLRNLTTLPLKVIYVCVKSIFVLVLYVLLFCLRKSVGKKKQF